MVLLWACPSMKIDLEVGREVQIKAQITLLRSNLEMFQSITMEACTIYQQTMNFLKQHLIISTISHLNTVITTTSIITELNHIKVLYPKQIDRRSIHRVKLVISNRNQREDQENSKVKEIMICFWWIFEWICILRMHREIVTIK